MSVPTWTAALTEPRVERRGPRVRARLTRVGSGAGLLVERAPALGQEPQMLHRLMAAKADSNAHRRSMFATEPASPMTRSRPVVRVANRAPSRQTRRLRAMVSIVATCATPYSPGVARTVSQKRCTLARTATTRTPAPKPAHSRPLIKLHPWQLLARLILATDGTTGHRLSHAHPRRRHRRHAIANRQCDL